MEGPKAKVTAKLSFHDIHAHGPSATAPPPTSSPPQPVVRAKISGTARVRSSTASSPSHANGNASPSIDGALRPQGHAAMMARRSPSPAKMRAASPSKLPPPHRPAVVVRASLSKAAVLKPDRVRHGSVSSLLSLAPVGEAMSTVSAPTSPSGHAGANLNVNCDRAASTSSSASVRITSKVSSLAKQPPSLSAILSPPPFQPSAAAPCLPSMPHSPRARAATSASRHPSITLSVAHSVASPLSHEHPQLVPLPSSPPTSALSFSSHSSTSASASSMQSASTSTGLTPPLHSYTSHARSESVPTSILEHQHVSGEPSLDGRSSSPTRPSPPMKRTLIARVRPGTTISGGRGRAWTSRSSGASERDLGLSGDARMAELANESTGESEFSGDETRKRRLQPHAEPDPEDNVRAEAKSNRKIADLEITTRSLLTINSSLEASKLRQGREIRELRRKLRETRLAMPPGRFRLLSEEERDEGWGGDVEGEETDEDDDEGDRQFKRVKTLLEDLLLAGRSALAVPAPPSFLGVHHDLGDPSPSSASGHKTGLGIDAGPAAAATRMDQGEVLGWDVGSSLGTNPASGGGAETKLRRWKHGVAIGSKVLSPEEAKLWVGDRDGDEGSQEEAAKAEGGHGVEQSIESLETDEDATGSFDGVDITP